ncbi:MAG: DUF4838 domain-containing protein [Bacteroidia bacterium]|nr:DUF4838 domain-containing protein [Bacteroidia bacterium]
MKLSNLILIALLEIINLSAIASDSLRIVINGSGKYRICTDQNITEKGRNAALLLSSYINKITGATIPVDNALTAKSNVIAITIENSMNVGMLTDEGFRITTSGSNLFIRAKTDIGIQNAVYTIIEKYFGCRCYAKDAIFVPHKKSLSIGKINDIENPAFSFRLPYYYEAFNGEYGRWHKLSNPARDEGADNKVISMDWGMWVHTLHKLVPSEKYFGTHPEYYALRNGIRIRDQLCLSNPEVLKIAIESLKDLISKNPEAKYWSVSQLDNYNYCECEKCRAVDSIEQSHSGSIIRFVNQVAAAFPDKIISTLAYQFSRKAPVITRPADNVNIMLCTIECDRSKPIEADTSEGGFLKDIKGWSGLTHHILIWDYVINFSHLIAPFPNLYVLQPNIRLFRKYGADMLFEQGYTGKSSELNELRCYLISELMWNPDLNTDSIMKDFLNGYYGKAGEDIYHYLNLQNTELQKSGKALTLYEPPSVHNKGFLSPGNLGKYFLILNHAMELVKDDSILTRRVNMALQAVRYAYLEVAGSLPLTDDWLFEIGTADHYVPKKIVLKMLDELNSTAKKYGPVQFHESGIPPDEYYNGMKEYLKYGYHKHLAVGKSISFKKKYDDKYPANGPNSMIDGVRGTTEYHQLWQGWQGDDVEATIDFGKLTEVSKLTISCLDDNQSWIMAPKGFRISYSTDGAHFTQLIEKENNEAGKKCDRQIFTFTIPLQQPVDLKYLKVIINNIGKMPAWRGVDGNAWVFVDEIIVE